MAFTKRCARRGWQWAVRIKNGNYLQTRFEMDLGSSVYTYDTRRECRVVAKNFGGVPVKVKLLEMGR